MTPALIADPPRDRPVEGVARVIAVSDEAAWLEAEPKSACGGCASAGHCGVSALSGLFGRKRTRFRLANDFDARPGERVVIGISQSMVLRASLIAYMVPLLGLLIGAVGGAGLGDPGSIGGAVAGFAAGFLAARRLSAGRGAAGRLDPVFLRRAAADGAPGCGLDGRPGG